MGILKHTYRQLIGYRKHHDGNFKILRIEYDNENTRYENLSDTVKGKVRNILTTSILIYRRWADN